MLLDKKKVKAALTIADIVKRYSDRWEVRGKTIVFICPFHNDHKLGSCWAYLDAHAFTCESCKERADTLKLASQYTGISLQNMNALLERIVQDLSLPRQMFLSDGKDFGNYQKIEFDLPTEEEYQRLLGCSILRRPAERKRVLVNGSKREVVVRYDYLTFPALAKRDSCAYDNEILNRSRYVWRRLIELAERADKDVAFSKHLEGLFWRAGLCRYADSVPNAVGEFAELKNRKSASCVIRAIIKENEQLLKKALVNKKAFEEEIALREQMNARQKLKDSILDRIMPAKNKEGCI